ncbi:MAG: hypothetical protein WAO56_05060 [Miniphocaeibacter sp.]|jgi:DNA-binding transcriptional ArsR family regulator|uniref:hypothetical protein n=1 Tax=Miniphocaeibacter sp. TaxID=3100973 RepID=UPI0017EDC582|nr:hypothetical protein [Gallicola sp.]
MLLPARTAVLKYLYNVEKADVSEIMEKLKNDYGNEGQFTKDMFLEHLMALEANELIELVNYELDNNGELAIYYSINDEGKNTIEKYILKK